jgi:ethanolamine utilization protein EutQ (cupin superfamily)
MLGIQGKLMMTQYKVDFNLISWNMPATGVRSKVHEHGGKQLRLVEFTDKFIEPDWCTKGHIGFVLEGKLEVNFNGKLIVFKPGDGLFIPAGKDNKHMAKVLTDVVKLILVEDT